MTSKAEMIGAALAKAVKATTGIASAKPGPAMVRTNITPDKKCGSSQAQTIAQERLKIGDSRDSRSDTPLATA